VTDYWTTPALARWKKQTLLPEGLDGEKVSFDGRLEWLPESSDKQNFRGGLPPLA